MPVLFEANHHKSRKSPEENQAGESVAQVTAILGRKPYSPALFIASKPVLITDAWKGKRKQRRKTAPTSSMLSPAEIYVPKAVE